MEKNEPKFISLESENRGKKYLDRVSHIEKHLDNLCSVFSGYTVKSAQLRDKNDEIAKSLHKFSQEEPFETTMKLTMKFLTQILATVGDYRDMEVERLEGKVLSSLTSYGDIFKYLKTDIRKAMGSSRKESERRKDLERFLVKGNESKYREAISIAESALERALNESKHLNEQIEEQMMKFEHKRLVDVKESLEHFLKVEIAVSAKLVELFTEAFQTVHNIDIETDMEVIRDGLKLPYNPPQLKKKHKLRSVDDWNVKTSPSILTTGNLQEAKHGTVTKGRIYSPMKVYSDQHEMLAPIRKKAKEIRQRNKIAKIMEESNSMNMENEPDTVRNRDESWSNESDTESDTAKKSVLSDKLKYGKNPCGEKKTVEIKYTNKIIDSSHPRSYTDIRQRNNNQVKKLQERQSYVERSNVNQESSTLVSKIAKDGDSNLSEQDGDLDYDAFREEDESRYAKSLLKGLKTQKVLFERDELSGKLNVVTKKKVSFGDSDNEAKYSRRDRAKIYRRSKSPVRTNSTKK